MAVDISSYLKLTEGHVYHSRENGHANRFRYPIFYVLFETAIETELDSILKRRFLNLLSIQPRDYLNQKKVTLNSGVKEFLKTECQYEAEEVWLHTMPRMFGYGFNPVSFWYCKKLGVLDAVLVEVHNTFGERHFYFVNPTGPIISDSWLIAKKVFHVSPFFPVDGFYKFRFLLTETKFRVDINFFGDDEKLRLATWIEGVIMPLQQYSLSKILLKYGWMTPLVVLRIHYQAIRLWLKRAKFYKKPDAPDKLVS